MPLIRSGLKTITGHPLSARAGADASRRSDFVVVATTAPGALTTTVAIQLVLAVCGGATTITTSRSVAYARRGNSGPITVRPRKTPNSNGLIDRRRHLDTRRDGRCT